MGKFIYYSYYSITDITCGENLYIIVIIILQISHVGKFKIQRDHLLPARRPDRAQMKKKKEKKKKRELVV